MPEKSPLRRSGPLNMIFFEILQNKIKEEKSLLRRSGLVWRSQFQCLETHQGKLWGLPLSSSSFLLQFEMEDFGRFFTGMLIWWFFRQTTWAEIKNIQKMKKQFSYVNCWFSVHTATMVQGCEVYYGKPYPFKLKLIWGKRTCCSGYR